MNAASKLEKKSNEKNRPTMTVYMTLTWILTSRLPPVKRSNFRKLVRKEKKKARRKNKELTKTKKKKKKKIKEIEENKEKNMNLYLLIWETPIWRCFKGVNSKVEKTRFERTIIFCLSVPKRYFLFFFIFLSFYSFLRTFITYTNLLLPWKREPQEKKLILMGKKRTRRFWASNPTSNNRKCIREPVERCHTGCTCVCLL